MIAAYLNQTGGSEVLEVGELPTPEVSRGQVRVRLKYASLNHLDIWIRRGLPHLKLTYPHILGADGAGLVDAVGEGVSRVSIGDQVIVHPGIRGDRSFQGVDSLAPGYRILGENALGTNAQYIVVPAENCFAFPSTLSLKEAATIALVFTTAWQMVVVRGQLKAGEWVLVHSAGSGVGSAAIQIAKGMGARVIATAGSDAKLGFAASLGAESVVNYSEPDWEKKVRAIAKGGVHLIVDHLGEAFWEANLKCLAWGGRLVLCGATTGPKAQMDLRHVFFKQWQIMGSTMGSLDDFPKILRGFDAGTYRPVVDTEFELSDIRKAHQYVENRKQFGKVLLIIP